MCINLFMTEIIIIELGYSHIHGHAPSRLPVKMLRRLLHKRRKLRDFVWPLKNYAEKYHFLLFLRIHNN